VRPAEDDLLEALPVEIGGVEHPPVAVMPPPRPSEPRALLIAVCDALAEATAPGNSPWSHDPAPAAPSVSVSAYAAAFSRMIVLDDRQLARLPDWWRARARNRRVEIARRLTLGPPRSRPGGSWVLPARLRSPWRPRSLPADLLLWPHLGAFTKLRLEPARGVHVGRRYFASGQRVLDELSARLAREM
jgi:hypothetical protein